MSSTIKCVSCKQRINLAPDASGIVTCPMCKTQQSVPEEQGQHAPQLAPPPAVSPNQTTADRDLMGAGPSSPGQSMPPQHDFDSPKGGCGCLLLAGLLLAITVAPLSMLVFFAVS